MKYPKQIIIFSMAILGLFIFPNISKATIYEDFETYSLGNLYEQTNDWHLSGIGTSTTVIYNDSSYHNTQHLLFDGSSVSNVNGFKYIATTTAGTICFGFWPDILEDSFFTTTQLQVYSTEWAATPYAGFAINDNTRDYKIQYNGSTSAVKGTLDNNWNSMCITANGTSATFTVNGTVIETQSTYPDNFDYFNFSLGHKSANLDYITSSDYYYEYYAGEIEWDYSGTLREDIPDFTTGINTVCFVGEDCNIWVNYNELMDGEEIRLIDNSNNLLDAETVSWVAPPEVALVYPYTAETAGQIDYFTLFSPVCYEECLFDVCVDGCGITKGGFAIEWWDEDDYLPDFPMLGDVCYGISTSTTLGAIECGLKRSIAWAFEPNATTTTKLANTVDDFWDNFPFATMMNVKTILSNATSSETQLIPVLSATGTVMGYVFDAENIEASSNYWIVEELKSYLNYAIIFFFGIYLITRIISLVNGANLPDVSEDYIQQQRALKSDPYAFKKAGRWYSKSPKL